MIKLFLSIILIISVSIIVQGQAQKQPDAQTERQREVKAELNKAEIAYKESRFANAQQHAEKALEIESSNEVAPLLLARSIHAQYDIDSDAPENFAKAREAIAAYQRITTQDPNHDEAFQAVRELYGTLNEYELQYAWVRQRALSAEFPVEKRIEAFLFLAGREFHCSSAITTANRYTEEKDDSLIFRYRKPEDQKEFEQAQQCTLRGLSMTESAIALQPENDRALSMKSALLYVMAKLAEMDGKQADADKYSTQSEETEEQATGLKQRREEAAWARAVTVDCGELCGLVISAQVPTYPPIARSARAHGAVTVQVIVDEEGRINAAAMSGHPLLRAAAVQAAHRTSFQPKIVDGQAVKFTGVLIYNFTLP